MTCQSQVVNELACSLILQLCYKNRTSLPVTSWRLLRPVLSCVTVGQLPLALTGYALIASAAAKSESVAHFRFFSFSLFLFSFAFNMLEYLFRWDQMKGSF